MGYQISNRQQQTITRATELALELLVSKRLANTLDIQYNIVKDLYAKEGIFGDCWVADYDRSPKFFDIRLPWTTVADIDVVIATLCHEMIHVAQYAQRRLRWLASENIQAFEKEYVDMDEVNYYDLPWEKEAYEREGEVCEYVRYHMADRYNITLQKMDDNLANLYAKKHEK